MDVRYLKYIIFIIFLFTILDVSAKLIEGSYRGTDDSGGSCSLTITEDGFEEDTSREIYSVRSNYTNKLIKGTFPAQVNETEGKIAIDWNEIEAIFVGDSDEQIEINIFLENAVPSAYHFERTYLNQKENRKCRFLELL